MKQPARAADFKLKRLGGDSVELKSFQGNIVMLTFWATWCGPCKEELPSIEALHQYFKDRPVVVLTVSVDLEGVAPVERFIRRQGYSFRVLLDPKGETLELYRVEKIPVTFLIDKKSRVIGKALGPRDWRSPEAFALFNRLIQEDEK